jgi:alpha-tubulin suppressor-like RCC1 family protein
VRTTLFWPLLLLLPGRTPVAAQAAPGAATVVAGAWHSCRLTDEGMASCWGLNNARQLGSETREVCRAGKVTLPCSRSPLPLEGQLRFTSLAAGEVHTCGLTGEGQAYCWGGNARGQLGTDSTLEDCTAPGNPTVFPCTARAVPVAGDLIFEALAAGAKHTCGLTSDGVVFCWGSNDKGQLGVKTPGSTCLNRQPCSRVPLRVDVPRLTALVAGGNQTCGLRPKGDVLCWGTWGRWTHQPARVPSDLEFSLLAVGLHTIVGLTTDSMAYYWGTRYTPEGRETFDAPKSVRGFLGLTASGYTMLAVGAAHVCALDARGIVYCWGDHGTGQLGIGREGVGGFLTEALREGLSGVDDAGATRPGNWKELPKRVSSEVSFSRIATGYQHTCGLGRDGQVYCWGNNDAGQLGSADPRAAYKPRALGAVTPP